MLVRSMAGSVRDVISYNIYAIFPTIYESREGQRSTEDDSNNDEF
jgi:hypothetical protein